MIGAILGDIIGSVFEGRFDIDTDFPLFCEYSTITDDSVLTLAVGKAIVHKLPYKDTCLELALEFPMAGYGSRFIDWMFSDDHAPYDSYGNGAAMRVGPVGLFFNSEEDVLSEAKKTAEFTHNHPEGIKGAQATAMAVAFGKQGKTKYEILERITSQFGYDLSISVEEYRADRKFELSCQGTVPAALAAFSEGSSYEDIVRRAISMGGDCDTLACIAGSIAEGYYGLPDVELREEMFARLPENLEQIVREFYSMCGTIL